MVDAHNETKAIFDPLKKRLPIKAFAYLRFYLDGKRFIVADNEPMEKLLNAVLRHTPIPHLPENTSIVTRVGNADNLILTTSSLKNHSERDFYKSLYTEMLTDLFSGFQLACAFSIFQRKKDYYEEFLFYPALNDETGHHALFCHQDLLHNAMFLFQDKAHDSLKMIKPFNTSAPKSLVAAPILDFGRKMLLENVTARRFYLDSGLDTYLTRKEALSAFFLTQSMSSSQIAEKMGISKRTVEDHIENIKLKTGISHKFDLIQFLIRNNFNQLSSLTEL